MLTTEQQFISRLQRTQWLPPDDLMRYQQPLIERLARHAATQTDFYPARLAPLFGGGDAATTRFDFAKWSSVPVIARADAIHHVDQMRARTVPPETGDIREGESSGSTGRRLKHTRSAIGDMVANCMLDRVYELFDLDLNGTLAFITLDRGGRHSYPEGSRAKDWNRTNPDADVYMLDIGAGAVEQLEWLERVQPTHVMSYPMNMLEVAAAAFNHGSNLKFKTFISSGEVLSAEMREKIARSFGCQIIDVYGVREIGQIAFQCPDSDRYHFCSEAVFCELLDEQNNPAGPGQYGRVVVTALYNYAMPFIRYEIGDYALASRMPCSCGRGLGSIDEIGGRMRNMLVMPDGSRKRIVGRIFSDASDFLSYQQIQFVQCDVNTIVINYVPDDITVRPDLQSLTEILRRAIHSRVVVRLVPVDRIERGAGMKIEQFISRVA
jgi:phenylacetate-CoA ligase